MTGEEFIKVWNNLELRQYIIDQARRHSKNEELKKDYIQEAWIRISLCEFGADIIYYKKQAYRGIHCAYEKKRKKEQRYKLEFVEYMDKDVYTAWQMGYYKKI